MNGAPASKTQKRHARKQRTNDRIAAAGQQIDDRSRDHKWRPTRARLAKLEQHASSAQHVAAAVRSGAAADAPSWYEELTGDVHEVRWRYPPSTFP